MYDVAVRTFLIGLMLYMFWFGMPYSIFHYFTMQAQHCLLLYRAYVVLVLMDGFLCKEIEKKE